jgi:hypothetical protein
MTRIFMPILMTVLAVSCGGLPKISPVVSQNSSEISNKCHMIFPKKEWRFVHAIEADLPGGEKAFMMGITQIAPEQKTIHSILMTIEGLVLFDAVSAGTLTVNRAVPPFDSENFAKGLLADVRLMFLAPDGEPVQRGLTETGSWICRFQSLEETTDVVVHQDNSWTIHQYHRHRLRRVIHAHPKKGAEGGIMPETLSLTAAPEYSLQLKLVEAEPL